MPDAATWGLEQALVRHLESIWREPDEGIWEVRGGRKHFTHSKVMAWVAFDRAVRSIEEFGLDGPLDRWRRVRDADSPSRSADQGFDAELNSFVQSYGSNDLDASLLHDPAGRLPAARRSDACEARWRRSSAISSATALSCATTPASGADGLPPGEGAFLACSFWLADNYVLQGRHDEARALFERLLALRNDVGLLAEEYDPVQKRQLGNFPQAFSHLALVNTAHNLVGGAGPAHVRSSRPGEQNGSPSQRRSRRRRPENGWRSMIAGSGTGPTFKRLGRSPLSLRRISCSGGLFCS